MKRFLYLKAVLSLSLIVGLTACSEDDGVETKRTRSELDGMYSNKSGDLPGQNTLELYFDGYEFFGKQAYFELKIENRPTVTLFDVIPGEREYTLELDYQAEAGLTGFSVSGSNATPRGITFDYVFEIRKGWLTFHVDNLTLPSNKITDAGVWNPVLKGPSETIISDPDYTLYRRTMGFYLYPTQSNSTYELLGGVLSSLVSTVLREITFTSDGNVTARYAPLPEDMDIFADLVAGNGVQDRPDSDWKVSPKYMVKYYVEGDYLYIVPNAEMLVRQLTSPSTRADGGDSEGESEDTSDYIAIYNLITEWFTEGLRFTIADNPKYLWNLPNNKVGAFDGDIFLHLDQSQIQPLAPLLSIVGGLLPESMKEEQPMLYNIANNAINQLTEELSKAETVQVGIYLKK